MMGRSIAATLLLAALPTIVAAASPDLRVVLLGTGGPELSADRAGEATLIEAGGQMLLFDAGRELLQRLYESRIDPTQVTRVFLTHLHSDHIEGLPSLWITPWFLLGREQPIAVWGPPGTARMIDGMRAMYGFDIEHRSNAFNKAANLDVAVTEIKAGAVYEQGGLTVTAFPVWHDDGNPAFGYRIDYRRHTVVLSGDTTYSENLVKAAQGADLIVHNVVAMSARLSTAPEMQPVLGKLTTPEQAARVFIEDQPRLAVLSHIVKKELPGTAGDAQILARVRKAGYAGPLRMGTDRMTIEIGDEIRVLPPAPVGDLPDLDRKPAYASADDERK